MEGKEEEGREQPVQGEKEDAVAERGAPEKGVELVKRQRQRQRQLQRQRQRQRQRQLQRQRERPQGAGAAGGRWRRFPRR